MIQLDVLGALDLRAADGSQIDQLLRQPKRLALLAYLAMPIPGTWHRRDVLLGIFWPDLDSTRARTALRNALYVLRQSLGDGVVLTRGDEEVSIDPRALQTDLAALGEALRAGRLEEALSRYRGELLPGLYPPDSPEFLPWLDGERARLRHQVARAGSGWVLALENEGRLGEALTAARRVLEINPDDETVVRRLMMLHDRLGDRAGGLAVFEEYARRLAKEYDAQPARETTELAEQMRGTPGTASSPPAALPRSPVVQTPHEATGPDPVPVAEPDLPPEPPRGRARLRAGVAVLVLVALSLLGWEAIHRPVPLPRIGRSFPVTADEGLQIEPSISPNGQLVAYAKGTPTRMRIFVQRLEEGTPYPLTRDSGAVELLPRWSPGSDQVAFLSRHSAWIAPANLGTPRVVAEGSEGDAAVRSVAWSPRGDSVVIVRSDSLMVRPLTGPGSRLVGRGTQLHSCVWSPDGRWIACVSGNWKAFVPGPLFGNRAPSAIVIFPAAGGPGVTITDLDHVYQSPAWSADSRFLWVISDRDGQHGEVFAIPIGGDGRPSGPFLKGGLTAESISLSPGRMAYAVSTRSANAWSLPIPPEAEQWPVGLDRATRVTSGSQVIEIVRVSRDGRWLVYDSDLRGNADLYRMPLPPGSGQAERLTDDARPEFGGELDHDNRTLVYHLWVGRERRLHTKRLEDGVVEAILPERGDQGTPRWSPDGTAVAAWSPATETGTVSVVRRAPDGQWQVAWEIADAQLPVFAPHGRAVVFVTLRGSVEMIPADSGARRVLYAPRPGTEDPIATYLHWQPGGAHLWFLGHTPAGDGGIWAVPPGGGRPRQVVDLRDPAGRTHGPSLTADGRSFYFTLEERQANIRWVELVR